MGRVFGVKDQFRALGLHLQVEAGPGHFGEGCWLVRHSDVGSYGRNHIVALLKRLTYTTPYLFVRVRDSGLKLQSSMSFNSAAWTAIPSNGLFRITRTPAVALY